MHIRQRLRRQAVNAAWLAEAFSLDKIHLKNALAGRSPFKHEEVAALTAALDCPVSEILDPAAIERTYGGR